MTKVKMLSGSVVGASATAIQKKANNATPSHVLKGKIKKNRINTKGEKINLAQSNYINKYLEVQSRIRLCFVNIKRDSSLLPSSSFVVSVNRGSNNKQLTTTSQDHSRDDMDRNKRSQPTVDKSLMSKNPPLTAEATLSPVSPQDEAFNVRNAAKSNRNNNKTSYKFNNMSQRPSAVEGERSTLKDSNENEKYAVFKIQAKMGTAIVRRKCVVKLQKLPKSQTEEFYARNAAKDALLASQIISPTLDHEKRSAFRKLSLSMHSNPKGNDGSPERKQTSIESNVSGNEMLESNSKTTHNTKSLQKINSALNCPNKSTRPQRNLRNSIQPASTTKMRQQKECRIATRNHNQFPRNCKENSKNGISDKNLQKGTSKENLTGNHCIDTSFSSGKENQTKSLKRCAIRNHGQLLNALTTYNKILANKVSKDIEAHRDTKLSNVNELHLKQNLKLRSEIVSNSKLLVAKINKNNSVKEIQKESEKVNPPSGRRENQIDNVFENCTANEFSEKSVQNESIDNCLNGYNKNVTKRETCKTDKKNLDSKKSVLDSNNTQVVAPYTSPSKDFQPQRNTTLFVEDLENSPKLTSKEKDEPKEKCINLTGNDFSYPRGMCASKQRPPAATVANKKLPTLRTTNKTMNTTAVSDFQPQRNSTMRCEEKGHLAVIESDVENMEKEYVTQDERIAEVSDNISQYLSTTENHTKCTNKTNKFFHRHETESSNRIKMPSSKHMVSTNTKDSRYLPKRTSQLRREQVYDFLSQSQTSDSDGMVGGTKKQKPIDPAADIIKKLIAEGKVVVATSKKGKGRPVLKRKYKKKPKKIIPNKNVAMKKNFKAMESEIHSKRPTEKLKSTPFVVENEASYFGDDHFMDNDDDDDVPVIVGEHYNIQKLSSVEPAKKVYRNLNGDQDGTFSNLAISVLINQAGRNDPQRLKAQRLLSMAKKLISTPKNKNIPSIRTTMDGEFSPIPPMMQPRPATKPSPWRIDEDAHLPTVFNFTRSSGNLPSFSSDFIPPTPRKEKPSITNISKVTEIDEQQAQVKIAHHPIMEGIAALPNQFSTPVDNYGVNSSIPSFSSNDSNAENKTPPGQDNQTNNENDNIFNLKQLPNPRRALDYRSPLQVINITEVVQLPSLEMSKFTNSKETPQTATICNNKKLSQNGRLKSVNIPNEDLFGFEDLLSQTEHSSQEEEPQAANNVPTIREPPDTINEKRHGLRKFKPDTTELQVSLERAAIAATGKMPEKNKDLFIDTQSAPKPLQTVREMLCSTMLHKKPTTNRTALKDQRDDANYRIDEESNMSGMLFRDMEPETTFNEEDPHRTYIRPFKRKRRLKEHGLIFALESEESDIEENDSAGKKKPTHGNRSRETDTSSETQKQNKKKKKKIQRKENPELKHFVEEFNEMCKEVENYNLILEKSDEVV